MLSLSCDGQHDTLSSFTQSLDLNIINKPQQRAVAQNGQIVTQSTPAPVLFHNETQYQLDQLRQLYHFYPNQINSNVLEATLELLAKNQAKWNILSAPVKTYNQAWANTLSDVLFEHFLGVIKLKKGVDELIKILVS